MEMLNGKNIQTVLGDAPLDSDGAPLAVARMDPERSYRNTAFLLQRVIRDSDERAWREIRSKIDYTYEHIDRALSILQEKTNFLSVVRQRLEKGQKILFKPNLVNPAGIDPHTAGPTPARSAETEWPFAAAVMRWFHDRAGISYYRMSVGEAPTSLSSAAANFTHIKGSAVTTEAVIPGPPSRACTEAPSPLPISGRTEGGFWEKNGMPPIRRPRRNISRPCRKGR